MKVKNEFLATEQLMGLGFQFMTEEQAEEREEYELEDKYVYNLGHARRGQFYYITIDIDGEIRLFASRPDGSGTDIIMSDVLIQMYKLGMIEEDDYDKTTI